VEEHLQAVCQADPYLRRKPARVEWILDADCAEVSSDSPFVVAMREVDIPVTIVTKENVDKFRSLFR
jgi:hypothetical protein